MKFKKWKLGIREKNPDIKKRGDFFEKKILYCKKYTNGFLLYTENDFLK